METFGSEVHSAQGDRGVATASRNPLPTALAVADANRRSTMNVRIKKIKGARTGIDTEERDFN